MNPNKYIIRNAIATDAPLIVELFQKNYPNGYYESAFFNEKNLEKMLNNVDYQAFIVIDPLTNKAIAYRGLTKKEAHHFHRIYLCHLLVDSNFRKQGIGQQLDYTLEKYLSLDSSPKVVYGLVILRTEASLKNKLKGDYQIWGIRNFYGKLEPSPVKEGHLYVVGKLYNVPNVTPLWIPSLHKITRPLFDLYPITECKKSASSCPIGIRFPKNVRYGQFDVEMYRDDSGSEHINIIDILKELDPLKQTHPYLAIRINTSIEDLVSIEKILLQNNYFPTSFLPYYDFGEHMIEYQYISPKQLPHICRDLANYHEILSYKNISEQ